MSFSLLSCLLFMLREYGSSVLAKSALCSEHRETEREREREREIEKEIERERDRQRETGGAGGVAWGGWAGLGLG